MIKGAILAAVAAVGIGAAAEAATYKGTFTLDYAEEQYFAEYDDNRTGDGIIIYDLPSYWGVPPGETVEAFLTITSRSLYGDISALRDWAMLTVLGQDIYDGPVDFEPDGSMQGYTDFNHYRITTLRWDGIEHGDLLFTIDTLPWVTEVYGRFNIQPAPVPLPASVGLLPLGLGALALMRRRRKVS